LKEVTLICWQYDNESLVLTFILSSDWNNKRVHEENHQGGHRGVLGHGGQTEEQAVQHREWIQHSQRSFRAS